MSEEASESGAERRWFGSSSQSTRVSISLACSECKARNYKTTKTPDQLLTLKKFCKQCKKHTVHGETK